MLLGPAPAPPAAAAALLRGGGRLPLKTVPQVEHSAVRSQNMDRHTEHTQPRSICFLWQKHDALKSTFPCLMVLSMERVCVSALNRDRRYCSSPLRSLGRRYRPPAWQPQTVTVPLWPCISLP